MHRHLTAINDLSTNELHFLLELTHFYSQNDNNPQKISQTLKHKTLSLLFFENSTRTKFSFELAAKKLGAHILDFHTSSSSLSKGESLYDTLKTFESFGADGVIIRHSDDHYIHKMKSMFDFSIVNAGAGQFEHPSQSLLDLFTIQQEFGKLEGVTVTICGDISSSRVAKSNICALGKVGAKVLLCGPKQLLPSAAELPKHCQLTNLDEAIKKTDALMFLRLQHERHQAFELNIDNYNNEFGLNEKRLNSLKPTSIIMHPGPVNRGVEILDSLMECSQSRIAKQVQNGVYTRMAILDWILNQKEEI